MTKEFNNVDEIKKYYNEETNTYIFKEDGELLDVAFNFNLNVDANIEANNIKGFEMNVYNIVANNINVWDISAANICANNIEAWNIAAWDINAFAISYSTICYAYQNIVCSSIKGRKENSKLFVIDGKLIIKGETNNESI